jgi:hypothetical protein
MELEKIWTLNFKVKWVKLEVILSLGFSLKSMLPSRVLQILLSNWIWYQNKSWGVYCGEDHAKHWHQFGQVLTSESELP